MLPVLMKFSSNCNSSLAFLIFCIDFLKIHCVSHCITHIAYPAFQTAMDVKHTEYINHVLPSCSIYCELLTENFITIL